MFTQEARLENQIVVTKFKLLLAVSCYLSNLPDIISNYNIERKRNSCKAFDLLKVTKQNAKLFTIKPVRAKTT